MIAASQLSRTDCTSVILAHDNLIRLRCLAISWLDHRRLQASKRLTSNKQQTQLHSRLSARIMTFFM